MSLPQVTTAPTEKGKTMYSNRKLIESLMNPDVLRRKVNKDVFPVVRCRDCKHYEIHKPKVLENCERNGFLIPMKPGDFCSYGERKDNEA